MSLRLPPILCISYRNSISGCSKALRGLSVQSRVMGIFTHTSISPGPLLRQRSSRYTIRAGRNLPDKEFRYLRTVIVTAAVYWDFDQELAPHQLIFQHRAGITPYTSTFVSARFVNLAVRHPSAFALFEWFPSILRVPLGASVTLSEATAPVKLST